ncbi:unnamed protein product [Sphagnum balticum]
MKLEVLLSKAAVNEVADYHSLPDVGDVAFVADIGASESVVPSYHNHPYLGLLQVIYGSLGLGLELVLEHLKSVESQLAFRFSPRDRPHSCLLGLLRGDREYSEPVRSVVFEDFAVVLRDGAGLHDGGHYLGRTLDTDRELLGETVVADYAHPLQISLELEAAVDLSRVPPFALEGKDDLGVGMGLVELEPAELKHLDLHRVTNQFLSALDLDDGVVRRHVVQDGQVETLVRSLDGFIGVFESTCHWRVELSRSRGD